MDLILGITFYSSGANFTIYGNKLWKTPNIDELASKGTIFHNHHTGAPSTIMSNICMFTSRFAHETELSDYVFSKIHYPGETLWSKAETLGYKCHIIWDEAWDSVFKARERYFCYGENTVIHPLNNLRQGVGAHHKHDGFLAINRDLAGSTIQMLMHEVKSIIESESTPVFLWIHIPHVLNGFNGYGSDIEAFDEIIGHCREYFSDDNIFISADHGNMNAAKGKFCYGFDVYEPSACIPLITPLIEGEKIVKCTTSNVDVCKIIFDRKIPKREFIYCDSAFYKQPYRKLAIYYKQFKYIYNKAEHSEELYDINLDPHENCNLIDDYWYDPKRKGIVPIRELYYYPNWDILPDIRALLRSEKEHMWIQETWTERMKLNIRQKMINFKIFLLNIIKAN